MVTARFASLDKPERNRWLQMSLAAGDTAHADTRNPNIWLVSSDTLSKKHGRPVYWRVNVKTATCPCRGWKQRGICRHTARAIFEFWQAREAAKASGALIQFPTRHAA